MHLAVALGVAVTAAVLTGALLVGDSVRGSLRNLTLERLGAIEYSLESAIFFREELASELQARGSAIFAPAIVLQGSASHAESNRRTSGVGVLGFDARLLSMYPGLRDDPSFNAATGTDNGSRGSVMINRALSRELQAEPGDPILISFGNRSEVNPEFLLGRRDSFDLHRTLRLKVAQIIPDRSLGRFALNSHQTTPYNVYLPLKDLQKALDREAKVNTLLVSDAGPDVSAVVLQEDLQSAVALSDFGLRWGQEGTVLESGEMLIPPAMEEDVRKAASDLGISIQPVLTYLANSISSENGSIPYSTVSALDVQRVTGADQLKLLSGESAPVLSSDEILLNQWAARELKVAVEDIITLTYYVADWQENLISRASSFRLKGIVKMEGLAVDETLTPRLPGVQDAADMASWDPPVPIDFRLIRAEDEQYWDQYGAAPKAFLSYEAGLEMWRNRFGSITSVRFSQDGLAVGKVEAALCRDLRSEHVGRFRAVREEGLEAAEGSTDFGMLFIGFSLFLIVSAVLLVGLLFRLGVETRAREIGLFLSLGYASRTVRRRFLSEGIILAFSGSLLGLALAWTYASLLIAALRTVWVEAIGSSFLTLYIEPKTLFIGLLASLTAILASLLLTYRSLSALPPVELLSGRTEQPGAQRSRWARVVFVIGIGAAILLTSYSLLVLTEPSPVVFFLVGALLLVSGLALFSLWLRRENTLLVRSRTSFSGVRIAVKNSWRNPGRSLLSAALIASACFVIVAVGANQSRPGEEVLEKESGAGGFTARAEADVPLIRDLNSPEALYDLGFSEMDVDTLQKVRFAAYRLRPGEDISCRNLYQPNQPRLLGVPREQIERGGFQFQSVVGESDNPWTLLHEDLGKNVIPAIADANSATWILHRSLGDDILLRNEEGEEVRLRLVGLLARSIFQSELLISEENFEKQFPRLGGYSYFLMEMPLSEFDEVTTLLEETLHRYGFDATRTDRLLAGFLAIENTYLSTFQTLGGLGLLLGTVGLGIILIRNTIERRGELAALRAFGYSEKRLSMLVLLENCFLLGLGIILGTVSALIAVGPHILARSGEIPLGSLGMTLAGIFVVGSLVNFFSLRFAFRVPLLSALREE